MKNLTALLFITLLYSCSSSDSSIGQDEGETQNIVTIKDKIQGVWISSFWIASDGSHQPNEYQEYGTSGGTYDKIIEFVGDSIFYKNTAPLTSNSASYSKGKYELKMTNDSVFIKKVFFNCSAETFQCGGYSIENEFTYFPLNESENRFIYNYFGDVHRDVYFKN